MYLGSCSCRTTNPIRMRRWSGFPAARLWHTLEVVNLTFHLLKLMTCSSKIASCGSATVSPCGGVVASPPQSLPDVVSDYWRDHRPRAEREFAYWANRAGGGQVLREAALSIASNGKRHPHQRRIPARVLQRAADTLARHGIPACQSFDDLHRAVDDRIGDIHGIGELAVYDIACRIGASFGLTPERVYLHAGTREGARALQLEGPSVRKSDLPEEFASLSPAEIEDCLCIYKADIQRLAVDSHT